MPEYSSTITVNCPADKVFGYVSDIKNLSSYLPTVHSAQPEGADRVVVDGAAAGHAYSSDGWFKHDADARSMSWGSDGDNDYSGRMQVIETEDGAEVACTLHFNPKPAIAEHMNDTQGGPDRAIQEGLDASLRSIKNLCEGEGGKVATSADRSPSPH